jgi:hypothetical protein
MPDRSDDALPLVGQYTRGDGERILREGTVEEVRQLRTAIVTALAHIEGQLDDARNQRVDANWSARTRGAVRALRVWLTRISTRLSEREPRHAISIPLPTPIASHVVTALNELLSRGVHIVNFSVVGSDLVVIATGPNSG